MAAYSSAKLVLDAPSGLSAAERRLLATMPWHAITSVHGKAGLRERLVIEACRFTAADRARVGSAFALMSLLHAGDRRQREPYACHPLRVTIRVLSHHRVTDADVACAALLPDAVEDHAAGIAPGGTRQDALAVLAGQFGERTAELVAAVTNPVYQPGLDEHEQYREHVAASLGAILWARVIEVSDFTDNAIGLFHTTGPKLSKLASKYRRLAPVLREFILRPDTPLADDVKIVIAGQIDKATVRFTAICGDSGEGSHGSARA